MVTGHITRPGRREWCANGGALGDMGICVLDLRFLILIFTIKTFTRVIRVPFISLRITLDVVR